MKKGIIIFGIIFSAFWVIILTILLVALLFNKNIKFRAFNLNYNVIEAKSESFDLAGIEELKLNFISADIALFATDESELKVIQKTNDDVSAEYLFNSSKSESTLSIIDGAKASSFVFFGFGYMNYNKIEVYIPKSYMGNLSINQVSGDLLSNDLIKCNIFNYSSTSGDFELNSLECNKYSLKTVSGEISISNLKGYGEMKTTSGDIDLSNFNMLNNSSINTISGDVKISLTNKNCKVNYSSVSGDLDSRINNIDALYTLTIKTTSGDANIY